MDFSLLLYLLENYSDFAIDHRYENTYYIIRKKANPPIVFINSNRNFHKYADATAEFPDVTSIAYNMENCNKTANLQIFRDS